MFFDFYQYDLRKGRSPNNSYEYEDDEEDEDIQINLDLLKKVDLDKYFGSNFNGIMRRLAYNYYIDKKTNSLNWEVDVVGYRESDIEVKYVDTKLYIEINKQKEKESDAIEYFMKGINLDGGTLVFDIDINKYDVSKTNVTLENGILKVKVPANKSFVNNLSFKINVASK